MFNYKRVKELEDQLEKVMDQRDNLRARLDELQNTKFTDVYNEVQSSKFSFDWKSSNAFSIERIHEWNSDNEIYIATTVIGYLAPTQDESPDQKLRVGEWRFYCSQSEHDRLVKEFNEYKSKRK